MLHGNSREETSVAQIATAERRADSPDLRAIVPAARSGEEWALIALYEAYGAQLGRYLRATSSDGEALVARTWLAACRRARDFPLSDEGFRTWLVGLARELRGPRVRAATAGGSRMVGLQVALGDGEHFAAETLAGDAAAGRLVDCLPAEQAETLLLAVGAGCSVDAIATLTGRQPRDVHALLDAAADDLEDTFGAAGLNRLLGRVAHTVPHPPSPRLLDDMVDAVRGRRVRAVTALAAKAAVVTFVLVGGATGAAAATGTLPDAAQDRIASVASHVGVELPRSTDAPAGGVDPEPVNGEVTEPGEPAVATPPAGTHGADVSDVARDSTAEGVEKGRAVSDAAREGNGPAEQRPTSSPARETPPAAPPVAADQPAPQPDAPVTPSGGAATAPTDGGSASETETPRPAPASPGRSDTAGKGGGKP